MSPWRRRGPTSLGTLSGACQTLEVLNLEMLDPPMLDWVEMAGTITVFGDWVDHQWTLNGTALDATGPIIDTPPAGTLTLVAVDPGTGCAASLTATLAARGPQRGLRGRGVGRSPAARWVWLHGRLLGFGRQW